MSILNLRHWYGKLRLMKVFTQHISVNCFLCSEQVQCQALVDMCMTAQVGNSWRTTADIAASWENVLRCLDNTVGLSKFVGPGGWNDPDMLEVHSDHGTCIDKPFCRILSCLLPS